jgi:alpha-L-fucosidase
MFIHWGVYSELAGEWGGSVAKRNAEWIMRNGTKDAYHEVARRFNPVKFNAEEWVRLAKTAGMRYLVITAKHHDGFAMFHSKANPYNIVEFTPFKRDPLKELSEACARAGIRFCVYYSHSEDWDDPDAGGPLNLERKMPTNYERYLEQKAKPQLRELLTNYGPIGLVWFDRGIFTPEQAQSFVDLVRGLQPACLVNGRVGNYSQELMGDYQNMSDNGMPAGGIEEAWEAPANLNDTWGYSRFHTNWVSSAEVVQRLATTACYGGNYLLNIGPRGDGSIPEASVAILEQVGTWMQTNSVSIYGTTASPFPRLRWGTCTVKGNILYLHVFKPKTYGYTFPTDGVLELPNLQNEVRKASLLADPAKSLEVSRGRESVSVRIPPTLTNDFHTVVVVELDGPPRVAPPLVAEVEGKGVLLEYMTAVTSGKAVKRSNRGGGFHISKWTGPADQASWRVRFLKPGRFQVLVECAGLPGRPSGPFVIAAAGQELPLESPQDTKWFNYQAKDVGILTVAAAGERELVLRPAREIGQDVMCFKSLKLVRLP